MPAQRLLNDCLNGPVISASEPSKLFAFAQNCETALDLKEFNSGSLLLLEEETTQDTITNRLDRDLNIKWHDYRRTSLHRYSTVPFKELTQWIKVQAEIYLNQEKSKPSHQVLNQGNNSKGPHISKNITAHQQTRSQVNPGYNQARNKQNFNSQNQRRSQYGHRNSSGEQSLNLETPLHESTRASSPDISEQISRIDEMSCAWCKDKNLNYNHHTAVCSMFSKASESDKWKVADKHRLCSRCLEGYHRYSECHRPLRRCSSCNRDHHEIIGCRSRQVLSPSRSNQ